MATETDLIEVLKRRGVTPARELTRLLDISPATLSRLVRRADEQILRLGRTRGARYAVRSSVPNVGTQLPIWSIDEAGEAADFGVVHFLHDEHYWFQPSHQLQSRTRGSLYEGLPPFLADMVPQGYLGRFFPERYPDLDLPARIMDWSDIHSIQAIALRVDDAVGNLVAGHDSMNRYLSSRQEITRREQYPAITRDLAVHAVGSSAGGEFPKFTAFDGIRHLLVKFTSGDGSDVDIRWRDLLISEELAARVLADFGVPVPATGLIQIDRQAFLEVERFDRVGESGRRPVMSLGAVDDWLHGHRDSWPKAAARLYADNLLDQASYDTMLFMEAFARLIANSDRHFGNITFFWNPFAKEHEFSLSPIYDMLPMSFAPAAGGMVVDKEYVKPSPTSELLECWTEAADLAHTYWKLVADDERISASFRKLADSAAGSLRRD